MNSSKRGLSKYTKNYGIDDIYKQYVSEHKDDGFIVDEKTFKSIINDFNKNIMQAILYGYEYKMPGRLGSLRIKKKKLNIHKYLKDTKNPSRHQVINWKLTNKIGKVTFYLNEYIYRFYWYKRNCNIPNCHAYMFFPTRTHKRQLARLIIDKRVDYFL